MVPGKYGNLEEETAANGAVNGHNIRGGELSSRIEAFLPWAGSQKFVNGVVVAVMVLSVVVLLLVGMALELATQLRGFQVREGELNREIAALQAMSVSKSPPPPPSWTPSPLVDDSRKACSGHGVMEDNQCRCDDCWGGAVCAEKMSECVITAFAGSPFVFEDYWLEHPEASLTIKPAYHLGYGQVLGNKDCGIVRSSLDCEDGLMENEIRALHKNLGNFDTEGYHVIVGVGSTQILAAVTWALADVPETKLWAAAPFYGSYHGYLPPVLEGKVWWAPSARGDAPPPAPEGARVIEFVTSPNNPDGQLRTPQVTGPGARAVHDFAYHWPIYTPVTHTLNDKVGERDVAVFTLSKLTGHASTRIGWALVKDRALADRVATFVSLVGMVPRENQMRAVAVLKHARDTNYAVLEFARARMQGRWGMIKEALEGNTCYAHQAIGPSERDTWTGLSFSPAPAYLYIRCLKGGDCAAHFKEHGVLGAGGRGYGDSEDYVRLQLLMNEDTFGLLIERLRSMAAACA